MLPYLLGSKRKLPHGNISHDLVRHRARRRRRADHFRPAQAEQVHSEFYAEGASPAPEHLRSAEEACRLEARHRRRAFLQEELDKDRHRFQESFTRRLEELAKTGVVDLLQVEEPFLDEEGPTVNLDRISSIRRKLLKCVEKREVVCFSMGQVKSMDIPHTQLSQFIFLEFTEAGKLNSSESLPEAVPAGSCWAPELAVSQRDIKYIVNATHATVLVRRDAIAMTSPLFIGIFTETVALVIRTRSFEDLSMEPASADLKALWAATASLTSEGLEWSAANYRTIWLELLSLLEDTAKQEVAKSLLGGEYYRGAVPRELLGSSSFRFRCLAGSMQTLMGGAHRQGKTLMDKVKLCITETAEHLKNVEEHVDLWQELLDELQMLVDELSTVPQEIQPALAGWRRRRSLSSSSNSGDDEDAASFSSCNSDELSQYRVQAAPLDVRPRALSAVTTAERESCDDWLGLVTASDCEIQTLKQQKEALHDAIESTYTCISLHRSDKRNKLLRIELAASIMGAAMAVGTFVTSMFGMNVPNGLEDSSAAFYVTTGCVAIILLAGTVAVVVLARLHKV